VSRVGDCRHFTGYQNGVCKAGVCYREIVGGPDLGWAARLPCLPNSALRKESDVTCEKFSALSEAECVEREKEIKERFNGIIAARKRIIQLGVGSGIIECPVCLKRMGFTVAKSNGHVHARCETKGCLVWME